MKHFLLIVTLAQRKQFETAWRELVGSRTSIKVVELMQLLHAAGVDADVAATVAKGYDLDGDGYASF